MRLSKNEKNRLKQILEKYASGTASPEEQRFVEHYFDSLDEINKNKEPFDQADPANAETVKERIHSKLMPMLNEAEEPKGAVIPMYPRKRYLLRIAAVALLFAGTGLYLYLRHLPVQKKYTAQQIQNEIQPGHSGAILTLANGTSITLDSADDQQIAVQGNTQVINSNGALHYMGKADNVSAISYNTLSTPKARQYSLVLPDGSKVWLNASSSITFPTAFNGNERKVTVKGEAYFEVVHNSRQPFKVEAAGQEITDIGTSFNVSAYEDVPGIQATLIEGIIQVNGKQLRPGQAASVTGTGKLSVEEVNTEDAIAWKNGKFVFEKEDIQNVMRKLARWYDIDVNYTGNIPQNTFTGSVSRFDDINKILDKITYTSGIHFQIKERRIIVSE